MKKLLFTAIAAAGAAFGLQAAVTLPSGTSFEEVDASTAPVALNGASGVRYIGAGGLFSFPTNDFKADITAYTGTAPSHVDAFGKGDQYNFLDVKTSFGNPLNYGLDAAQDIGDGLYFDSLVKFTACDEAPTTDSYTDAKIVVWVQEDEDNHTTNFWIKAGQYANSAWGSAAYKCTNLTDFDMTAFHRLTIKAIKNITTATSQSQFVPGFVVFVDGEKVIRPTTGGEDPGLSALTLNASAAEFDNGKALFPSLVQGTQNALSIGTVGFDGQGAIDDIVLTATAPAFAKDNEFFTIRMGQNVTGFKYAVNSEEAVAATAAVQLPYTAGMTVTISDVTCADGFMYANLAGDTGVDVDGNVFTPGAKDLTGTINAKAVGVKVGTEEFGTLAEAFAYINETATGAVEMTLQSGLASGELAQPITIVAKAGLTSVKIDLAGKTISCETDGYVITSAVSLWITDSATGGKVENTITGDDVTVGAVIVAADEGTPALTIDAGTFDGMVAAEAGEISGGSFKDISGEATPEFYLSGRVKSGYVGKYNSGYYVVEITTFAFSVTAGNNAIATSIKINGEDAPSATEIADGASYEVVFTANTGYEFAGGQTNETKTGTCSGAAVTVTGSAAMLKQIALTLTGVAAANAEVTVNGVAPALTYAYGTPITIVATPTKDYEYAAQPVGWVLSGAIITYEIASLTEAATVAIPAATPAAPADWPDPQDIDETMKASEIAGAVIPTSLANVSAKALVTWAKANNVAFTGEAIKEEAFLLNCANTDGAVADAKEAFKFESFDPLNPPTDDTFASKGYNGTVTVTSYSDAACTTEALTGDQLFYRATLTPTPAPVKGE